MHGRMNVK